MELLDDFKQIILNPAGFFREKEVEGFREPMKFALVALTISGILNISQALFATNSSALMQLIGSQAGLSAAIGGLLGLVAISIISLFIGSSIDHIFVSLLGDDRYGKTFQAFAYSTAVGVVSSAASLFFVALPFQGSLIGLLSGLVAFGLFIYGLYVTARGIGELTELSFAEGMLAIAIPIILVILGILLAYFLAGSVMQSMILNEGGSSQFATPN